MNEAGIESDFASDREIGVMTHPQLKAIDGHSFKNSSVAGENRLRLFAVSILEALFE